MKKSVTIFGSTGSIGRNTLDILRRYRSRYVVLGLAVKDNLRLLSRQVLDCSPRYAAIYAQEYAAEFARTQRGIEVFGGREGLLRLAGIPSDIAVVGINGIEAIPVLVRLLESTQRIVLANKESLVVAGKFIMPLLKKSRVEFFPADSEMFALSLLLEGRPPQSVERVYLTASGGALREFSAREKARATVKEVLTHPTWKMGRKITVDSATMMNKAFEVMEASWLFGLDLSAIRVALHKESFIHALVALKNAAVQGCLFKPDMRIPLAYGILYPQQDEPAIPFRQHWLQNRSLSLEPLKKGMFPCFDLVMKHAVKNREAMVAANAANDVTVEHFLSGRIQFKDIYAILKKVLSFFPSGVYRTLDDLLAADEEVRGYAREYIYDAYA